MDKKINLWGFFQGLGRTFMLPVALLAAMGIVLGIGSAGLTLTSQFESLNTFFFNFIFQFMVMLGLFAFANLPSMFAMAIPLGLAKEEKGIAAFAGFVGFVVMNLAIQFFLKQTGQAVPAAEMGRAGQAMIMGMHSIDTGVLGGIFVGIMTYNLHKKYYATTLPDSFAFFSGARFVPIVTALFFSVAGLAVPFIWPFFSSIITGIGHAIHGAGIFGPFLFGAGERFLLPFGLHHILVAMIRFTAAGGTEVVNGETISGALNIYYAQLHAHVPFSTDATRFLSQGKMPTFLFGLPAACVAMYRSAFMANRPRVKGLFISGVIACVIGGITEPIEFLFLFAAPLLFAFHAVMTGLGFMMMGILGVAIGNTDGNLIDFIVFGMLQGMQTKWYLVLFVGVFWSAIYYIAFTWAIEKYNIQTPGREMEKDDVDETANQNIDYSMKGTAESYLKALGGKDNITSLENCITRLRLELKNVSVVDEAELKKLGAAGYIKLDEHNVQVIIGTKVHLLKNAIAKLMK